ncbi:hypothetical protein K458DRAFT_383124 [Lentithecium fluviatile CBS 122367]|uniref:MFS general substrate transporter n=1 Tax=Lentithecium fluviatile CBS 122367 TaxID=1168545 RepID=A0A6G1JIL4_9PLEO|nr:hypothetical protein K458DRAFT_383124 [Lentithecium fluviatile CBS 122367]
MGVLTFGLVIAGGKSWAGAAVGYAMEEFGAMAASNIAITYAVDVYRPIAGETIAIVFAIHNVIACLISTYITQWFQSQALRRAYGELVAALYIELWAYGEHYAYVLGYFETKCELMLDEEFVKKTHKDE